MKVEEQDIKQILSECGSDAASVTAVLQAVQKLYGYLPEEALRLVEENSEISAASMYGVASFYSQFRLEAVGENIIKVCVGTACHVKGASNVHDAFERELKLEDGKKTDKEGKYTLEKVACLGCCTIAPVVQINDITYGYVTTEQAGEIIADFESNQGKSDKKEFRTSKGETIEGEIRIGLGSCCVASGSDDVRKEITSQIQRKDLNVKLKDVGCVGMCHQVPLVEVIKDEEKELYTKVNTDDIKEILNTHFRPEGFLNRLKSRITAGLERAQYQDEDHSLNRFDKHIRDQHIEAFLGDQNPIATEHRGVLSPLNYEEYIAKGGFEALRKSIGLSSEEVLNEIRESGLRGRGGGGFPTYQKWEMLIQQKDDTKYLICNGDEGDPGAFMDRMLLESYPFRIIEGVLIAAYTVKASQGFFYIRAEYPLAVQRVRRALEICRDKNLLGEKILGTDFNFDIQIIEGGGAFVCGEETALISSIEGKRGFPQLRPPYPAEKGLWGKPTLVNNTETFAKVPSILGNGSKVFNEMGTANSRGTKVFSLAGKVERGGLIEIPMGMTIRHVVEKIGGGVAKGKKFKAVQIGGPSGGCIPHWLSDTEIDFESLQSHGAMMGSGGLVVLDEDDCMVDIARYFLSFTQKESCGKCTFCRVGTKRMLDILDRICEGKGKEQDIDDLEKLAKMVQKGSLCGLGRTAPNPVLSSLQYFREEYEEHVKGKCSSGKCADLIKYVVEDECIGCTLCSQKCPVDAIPFTPYEKHQIDNDLCIKCDACKQVCPENAIKIY